ncbi:MAG: glycosyltransferase family 4 protein [Pseudomonadota bacterium]
MQPVKITFILPYPVVGGGQRVISIYADALQKQGHEVTVLSQPARSIPLKRQIRSLLSGRGWARRPPKAKFFDGQDYEHRVLQRPGPVTDADVPDGDVVIATWWKTAEWALHLSPSKGKKVYFVQHYEVHDHLDVDRSAASYRLPLKKITIAQWLVDVMADVYGDHDVALVPNGVNRQHFSAPARSRQDPPTIGLIYSRAKFKGVDLSLAAIEMVRKTLPDLRVVSFGVSDWKDQAGFGKGDVYHKDPAQSDIPKLYAEMDVLVWASRSEGFGLPILEALSCGTPVVSSVSGCAPDVIEDGVNGYVVGIEDVEALADKLLAVLQLSPSRWKEMSENARASTLEYDWERSAEKFERALMNL